MDKAIEARFNALMETFNSQGWKEFINEIQIVHDSMLDGCVSACETSDQWFQTKGALQQLKFILNYEDAIQILFEDALNENDS